jgi:hypothetical protein
MKSARSSRVSGTRRKMGLSTLEYLLEDKATVPEDRGVLLGREPPPAPDALRVHFRCHLRRAPCHAIAAAIGAVTRLVAHRASCRVDVSRPRPHQPDDHSPVQATPRPHLLPLQGAHRNEPMGWARGHCRQRYQHRLHPTAPSRNPRHTDRDRSEWVIGIAWNG